MASLSSVTPAICLHVFDKVGSDVFLFAHQEEFLSLCVDKLTEILASDFLNASKEEMVFEAAMLWLNKCPSRKQSFEKVRFYILI